MNKDVCRLCLMSNELKEELFPNEPPVDDVLKRIQSLLQISVSHGFSFV